MGQQHEQPPDPANPAESSDVSPPGNRPASGARQTTVAEAMAAGMLARSSAPAPDFLGLNNEVQGDMQAPADSAEPETVRDLDAPEAPIPSYHEPVAEEAEEDVGQELAEEDEPMDDIAPAPRRRSMLVPLSLAAAGIGVVAVVALPKLNLDLFGSGAPAAPATASAPAETKSARTKTAAETSEPTAAPAVASASKPGKASTASTDKAPSASSSGGSKVASGTKSSSGSKTTPVASSADPAPVAPSESSSAPVAPAPVAPAPVKVAIPSSDPMVNGLATTLGVDAANLSGLDKSALQDLSDLTLAPEANKALPASALGSSAAAMSTGSAGATGSAVATSSTAAPIAVGAPVAAGSEPAESAAPAVAAETPSEVPFTPPAAATSDLNASASIVPAPASDGAGGEDVTVIWQGNAVPSDKIQGAARVLTPSVGLVRVATATGDVTEGRLYAVGQGMVWLETNLGRMALSGSLVQSIERLDVDPNAPPPDPKSLPGQYVRAKTPGGVIYGKVVAALGTKVTIMTDSGAKIVLDQPVLEPARPPAAEEEAPKKARPRTKAPAKKPN